jgi:hypothetical protein
MRILIVVVLAVASCASTRSAAGTGGGEVVSGEPRLRAAITGSATNSVATNGSVTDGDAMP